MMHIAQRGNRPASARPSRAQGFSALELIAVLTLLGLALPSLLGLVHHGMRQQSSEKANTGALGHRIPAELQRTLATLHQDLQGLVLAPAAPAAPGCPFVLQTSPLCFWTTSAQGKRLCRIAYALEGNSLVRHCQDAEVLPPQADLPAAQDPAAAPSVLLPCTQFRAQCPLPRQLTLSFRLGQPLADQTFVCTLSLLTLPCPAWQLALHTPGPVPQPYPLI